MPFQKAGPVKTRAGSRKRGAACCVGGSGLDAGRSLGGPAMIMRTSSKTVTFTRPFLLSGIEGTQPAGNYTVETGEELLQALSFEAWRRVWTTIRLPARPGGPAVEVVTIDPSALVVSLAQDAGAG